MVTGDPVEDYKRRVAQLTDDDPTTGSIITENGVPAWSPDLNRIAPYKPPPPHRFVESIPSRVVDPSDEIELSWSRRMRLRLRDGQHGATS